MKLCRFCNDIEKLALGGLASLDCKAWVEVNSGMRHHGQKIRISTRAFIAGVVICLFVLQGLLAALGPNAGHARGAPGSSIVASTDGALCDGQSDKKAPGHSHQKHHECCIFCNEPERAAPVSFVVANFGVAFAFASATRAFVVHLITDDPDPRSIGWLSSWSSRAPPSFS